MNSDETATLPEPKDMFPVAVTCVFALLVECLLILLLYTDTHTALFPQLFTVHTLLCLILAGSLYRLLPDTYRHRPLLETGFFFLLGFFLPVIGHIGLLLILILGIYRQQDTTAGTNDTCRISSVLLMPDRPPEYMKGSQYSAHGMHSRLQKSQDASRTMGIVLATRFMKNEHAVPLLKSALKNKEDDVRLLAFLLLEQKNNDINNKIETLQRHLDQETDNVKPRTLLARTYLDMVSQGLIQDEMKLQILAKAKHHLEKALQDNPNEANAHFMMGQVHLELGEYDPAHDAFTKSMTFGFPPDTVSPFLARIAFQRRCFEDIPGYLKQIPQERRMLTPLADTYAFWLQEGTP